MIAARENFPHLTPEEYFAWEEKQLEKHEYIDGEVYVMSGGTEMDLYHKNDSGEWVIINYQAGDIVELKSIALSFPIEQVYRGLVLTPESE